MGQTFIPDIQWLGTLSGKNWTGKSSDDYVVVLEAQNATLDGAGGNDNIAVGAYDSSHTTVNNTRNVLVKGGAGNDTISVCGSNSTMQGGIGNDFLSISEGKNCYLDGGAGDDVLSFMGEVRNATVKGGSGSDNFTFLTPHSENGKLISDTWVTITDLTTDDKLSFTPFNSSSDGYIAKKSLTAKLSGTTLTLTDTKYGINIKLQNVKSIDQVAKVKVFNGVAWDNNGGGKTKEVTTLGALIKGYNSSSSPSASLPSGITVNKSKKQVVISASFKGSAFNLADKAYAKLSLPNNIVATAAKKSIKITGNANANTIIGGSGNDYLYGGAGNDALTGGAGKDTFAYAANTGKDTISDYAAGDVLYITSGTIAKTLLSGKNVAFTVGKGTVTLKDAGTKTVSLKDSRGSYAMTKSALTLASNFTGTLNVANYLSSIKTLDGRAAAKKANLYGNAKANVLRAGKGGGVLRGYAGNDTLYGGAGKDVFQYDKGKDTIFNYQAGKDTIKFASTKLKSGKVSGSNVVLTLANGGTITVRGAAGKKISYVDSTGKTKSKVYKAAAAKSSASASAWYADASAPMAGASAAQLSSLISTTKADNLGSLQGTGLAPTNISGSSLVLANTGTASNPLTKK